MLLLIYLEKSDNAKSTECHPQHSFLFSLGARKKEHVSYFSIYTVYVCKHTCMHSYYFFFLWFSKLALDLKKFSLGKFSYGRKYMHIKSNTMGTRVTFSVSCSSQVWAEEANHVTGHTDTEIP